MTKSQETGDFVTFTEEILNGKFHFLCSELHSVTFLLNFTNCDVTQCRVSNTNFMGEVIARNLPLRIKVIG